MEGDHFSSGPLLWLFPAACTLVCAYDNFQVTLLLDAWKGYQELLTGIVEVVICSLFMAVKVYEFPEDPLINLPTCPANIRIYRDTAVIVSISYVLLLDINLSYLWLSIFPAIAIVFICALCIKLRPPCEGHERPESSNGDHGTTIPGSEKALQAMGAVPFLALLAMAQLDDSTADRFAISQFLLFLSTTVGALTYMMMRLLTGVSPGVAPASELLHKAFLLLVLVTVHTVAAEALGEDVVLFCILEVGPVLLWFILHLDRDSSIISIDKIKGHKNSLIVSSAVVIALLVYLATSMDESGLSICTSIMVACGVSGILTYYVAFMLNQWSPWQQSVVSKNVGANISIHHTTSLQSEKQVGKNEGAAATSIVLVQSEEQAGSSEEAVQLLLFWANALLIAAAALLLLKYIVARRLGQQEPLLDVLCGRVLCGRFRVLMVWLRQNGQLR